jgi:lipooligosaccharide transport system ATP-binding protein
MSADTSSLNKVTQLRLRPLGGIGGADEARGRSPTLVDAKVLTKRFGSYVAVDGVDFTVARGEVFGFLGPNGAGKTSTMRMIACVSPRSEGHLSVLGLDPDESGPEIRGRIGVVPQEDNLDTELTVWDNLVIYGRYFGLPLSEIRTRAAELLEFARLSDRRDDRVDPLSGGMKRRLTIARGLINQPELLLLDEPTTGLDPQARHLLWERLYRLKREGVTLVLTTHYMEEAEQLCDRLVIMDEGRIAAEGSPQALVRRHCPREVVELRYASPELQAGAADRLRELLVAAEVEALPDRVLVYTDDGDATAARLGDAGGAAGAGGAGAVDGEPPVDPRSTGGSLLVRRSSLEDVFLRLTGRSLQD